VKNSTWFQVQFHIVRAAACLDRQCLGIVEHAAQSAFNRGTPLFLGCI